MLTPVLGESTPAYPNGGTSDGTIPMTFVSSYGRVGGAQVYLERVLADLDASWIQDVVSLGHGSFNDRLARSGISVHVIPSSGGGFGLLTAAWRLRRRLVSRKPSLVHANGVKAAVVSALATIGTGVPVLWLKHDFALDGWRARLIARRCRQIVGVSSAVTGTFGNALQRKVHVVYPGLDPEYVDREVARSRVTDALGASGDAFLVTLVGQLIPGKGHLELVELLPELRYARPDITLVFVGATPSEAYETYVKQVEERVEELGMNDAVRFVGHRDDARTFIAGCDVLAIPSLPAAPAADVEGFPLVVLESMAAATPVVGYRVGGLHEQLSECGVLVGLRDRKALSEAILRLAAHPEVRDSLGRCGQQRVRERFTRRRMIESLTERYREAGSR